MKTIEISELRSERLILIPYTVTLCENFLNNNFNDLNLLGLKKGKGWPDADVLETLPRIISNLSRVEGPTGFESWMIIKKETGEVIGDIGFKGFEEESKSCDIGYGITGSERRNGYAEEAAGILIRWAFSNETLSHITARCLPENTGSVNLLIKLNFEEDRRDAQMIHWVLRRPLVK
ncbi:GNAT family N-acetyltransferase [Chryseobacterium arthrosphaerae]|uniref:GNAT family N-acetyltransferase n=1 Tax=Chryseobacterium arthrosphaerae TaxID=651561 RepID=UPI003D3290CD